MMPSDAPPGERDVQEVEARLAALYGDLTPAQQTVLATIVAAGLDRRGHADGDTSGFAFDPDTRYQAEKLELERAWRQADQRGALGEPVAARRVGRRGVLQPLVEFFRRQPMAAPYAGAEGSAPA